MAVSYREAGNGEREPDLGWLTRHRAAPPETSGPRSLIGRSRS